MILFSGLKLLAARDEYLKNHATKELSWYQLANEIVRHWNLLKGIGYLSACMCGEPVHFSLAMSNEQRREAKFLQKMCGVCPILENEKFQARQFDFSGMLKGDT